MQSVKVGLSGRIFAAMQEFQLDRLDQIDSLATELLKALGNTRKVVLVGELGAGKTTLVNALCRALGVEEPGSSPTFSLINQYAYHQSEGSEALVHHVDLYRLEQLEEAYDIGIEEVLDDPWYCFIEWPQLIESLLPMQYARIEIEPDGNSEKRIIRLEKYP